MSWTCLSNLQHRSLPNASLIPDEFVSEIDQRLLHLHPNLSPHFWGQSWAPISLHTMAQSVSHCLPAWVFGLWFHFFQVSSLKGCPTLLAIFPQNHPSLSCSPQLVLGHPVLHCFFPLPSMFPWLISYWTRGFFGFCFVLCCIVLFQRSLSRLTKIFFCDSGIRSIHNQVLSQSSLGQVYILLIF